MCLPPAPPSLCVLASWNSRLGTSPPNLPLSSPLSTSGLAFPQPFATHPPPPRPCEGSAIKCVIAWWWKMSLSQPTKGMSRGSHRGRAQALGLS